MSEPDIILKKIVNQHGITILTQPRLKGLILDMMATAERKHINVLKRAIDEQIGTRLLEMQHDDSAVRQIKINTLKEKFKNDNAFDDTAYYIVDCFIHALGWNNPETEIILPFKEIKIGDQIWADRNLDVSHFRNGDPIPEARTVEDWKAAGENKQPAWCYYNNDPDIGKIYGKLYNWYAVNDPRGLAPEGWHVSMDSEWLVLVEICDLVWIEKQLKSKSGWKTNDGNDKYGFSALPGGLCLIGGECGMIGIMSYYWSSDEKSFDYASNWFLSDIFHIGEYSRSSPKKYGLSVRCVKD